MNRHRPFAFGAHLPWRALFGIGTLAAALAVPAAASATGRSTLEPAARTATSFEYDASGRATSRVETGYDVEGRSQHVTRVQLAYDDAGGLLSEEAVTRKSTGELVSTALITYERDSTGEIVAEDRLWTDARGHQLRRESDRWRDDADGTRVCDTWEFDAQEQQVGTRYAIVTYATPTELGRARASKSAPRVLSHDESRYDASGAQTSRHLRQLEHGPHGITARTMYTFNPDDDVVSRVAEHWRYDGSGRLEQILASFFDGDGDLQQTSTDQRVHARDGRLQKRTYFFADAQGNRIRELDETYRYDDATGRLLTRDGTWRYVTR